MNKQLICIVPVVAAVALLQGGFERKGSFDITESTVAPKVLITDMLEKKGSFDITELNEAGGTSKGGDTPVVTGLSKRGSFDVQGKDPEVPVTPNLWTGKDPEVPVSGLTAADPKVLAAFEKKGSFDITELNEAGSGTGKGGDVPVTPGLMAGSGTGKGGDVPVTPGLSGQDPEYPVTPNVYKKGSFDITERIMAGGTSKGGEVPVTPGAGSGGKVGEVPVVTGFSDDEYTPNAGNGGKVGEVPVITG